MSETVAKTEEAKKKPCCQKKDNKLVKISDVLKQKLIKLLQI